MKRKACFLFFFLALAVIPGRPVVLPGAEDVAIKQVPSFAYFCLPYKGPFTDMGKVIGMMMGALRTQNVMPASPMIGVYYNSPDQVKPEDLQWEVGFPMTPQAAVQPPLEKKPWAFTTVASCFHKGPYERTGETISLMMKWLDANGYIIVGPVLETYLMDPSRVKPEDLKTEIWIPCGKK